MGADRALHASCSSDRAPAHDCLRTVVDAILSLASTGCPWRQLPKEFPPYSTVQGYFYAWSRDGTFERINYALVAASRARAGREASPTAPISEDNGKRRPTRL
jgi:transposase